MSIIGGVGTTYSSFFNCIRMGWNQYTKIILNIHKCIVGNVMNQTFIYVTDYAYHTKNRIHVHSMLVSWSFIKEEAHKDTFLFLGIVLMSRSFLLKLVTVSCKCYYQNLKMQYTLFDWLWIVCHTKAVGYALLRK